jgi:uncharacterized ubiquitin-like protein YukD
LNFFILLGDVVFLSPSIFCLTFDAIIISSTNLFVDSGEEHQQIYTKKALLSGSRIVQGFGTAVITCLGTARVYSWRNYYDNKFVNFKLFDEIEEKNAFGRRSNAKEFHLNSLAPTTLAVDIDSIIETEKIDFIWMEGNVIKENFKEFILKENQKIISTIVSLTTMDSFETKSEGFFGSDLHNELLHFLRKNFKTDFRQIRDDYITKITSIESKDLCITTKTTENEEYHLGYYNNIISR